MTKWDKTKKNKKMTNLKKKFWAKFENSNCDKT